MKSSKRRKRGAAISHEPLYKVWTAMKQRCRNPNCKPYPRYGGRGISICDEWESDYKSFRAWAYDSGYSIGLSIDRIDNDGNYCPENCRWTGRDVQMSNTSRNRLITVNGVSRTLSEWSRELGGSRGLVAHRLSKGWTEEEAVSIPLGRKLRRKMRGIDKVLELREQGLSYREIGEIVGAAQGTVCNWIHSQD